MFSDLEKEKDFTPDLPFEVGELVVVKFKIEETRGVKHYVGQILQFDGEA